MCCSWSCPKFAKPSDSLSSWNKHEVHPCTARPCHWTAKTRTLSCLAAAAKPCYGKNDVARVHCWGWASLKSSGLVSPSELATPWLQFSRREQILTKIPLLLHWSMPAMREISQAVLPCGSCLAVDTLLSKSGFISVIWSICLNRGWANWGCMLSRNWICADLLLFFFSLHVLSTIKGNGWNQIWRIAILILFVFAAVML